MTTPTHKEALRRAVSAAIAELPEEVREWRNAKQREAYAKADERRKARIARTRHLVEMQLSGHSRIEIEKETGLTEVTVRKVLDAAFPFGHPGANHRYIAIRLSTTALAALDAMCLDMVPRRDRRRALELVMAAVFEADALIARRTLKVLRAGT